MEEPTVPAPQSKEWFPEGDWLARHEALLAASQAVGKECRLVFLGDSITEVQLTISTGSQYRCGCRADERTLQSLANRDFVVPDGPSGLGRRGQGALGRALRTAVQRAKSRDRRR
eukprot:COSAG02_NODE_6558_length_3495_cov_9.279152_3_plen_115_part_00